MKRQSTNAAEVFEEIEQLSALAQQAERVEAAGCEAKLSRLKALMQQEGFFARPDQRLLLFTEFKDTLNYLGDWGDVLRELLRAEVDRGPGFLRLANGLSALYPRDSAEKRLLDAMLLAVPR